MQIANEQLVLAFLRVEELAAAAEHARAEAAYNETRFRALAASASSVVWEATPDGAITVDRESWERFTGATFDASDPEWGALAAVHPDDRVLVRGAWAKALATREPYYCEHRMTTASGYRSVGSRAVPIVVDGYVREWIGMMSDITDRVRIETAKEEFIGILGHDLRNPLAAISLGAEAFRDLPEPYGHVAQQMLRSVHRMDVMIHDIMDFTRSRLGGGIPVTLGPCDLGEIAIAVTDEIRQAHPRRDIRCEVHGELSGTCDAARSEQVFSNLLGNAITHGEDPVRLTVARDDEDILISVRNRGEPIPARVMPRLFAPFSRGYTPGERAPSKGLGLGLYIVHQIVTAHGGTIEVTSSVADGTEVAIRWPRRRRPQA